MFSSLAKNLSNATEVESIKNLILEIGCYFGIINSFIISIRIEMIKLLITISLQSLIQYLLKIILHQVVTYIEYNTNLRNLVLKSVFYEI